jgi:hypothetical protein
MLKRTGCATSVGRCSRSRGCRTDHYACSHINIVKFGSKLDEEDMKILDYIQIIMMAQDAPDKVGSEWEKEDRVKAGMRFLIH